MATRSPKFKQALDEEADEQLIYYFTQGYSINYVVNTLQSVPKSRAWRRWTKPRKTPWGTTELSLMEYWLAGHMNSDIDDASDYRLANPTETLKPGQGDVPPKSTDLSREEMIDWFHTRVFPSTRQVTDRTKQIRHEYETTSASYNDLAKKYDLSLTRIATIIRKPPKVVKQVADMPEKGESDA